MQNLRENNFEMKQNLNWSKSARIQGEMIIQLQAAIFERIWNDRIQPAVDQIRRVFGDNWKTIF